MLADLLSFSSASVKPLIFHESSDQKRGLADIVAGKIVASVGDVAVREPQQLVLQLFDDSRILQRRSFAGFRFLRR